MITLETGIASGIRRIEAVTGKEALQRIQNQKQIVEAISAVLNRTPDEIVESVEQLKEEVSRLEKEDKRIKVESIYWGSYGQEETVGPYKVRFDKFREEDLEKMAIWVDKGKDVKDPSFTVGTTTSDTKPVIMISTSYPDLDLGSNSKEFFAEIDGKGGGKRNFTRGTYPANITPNELIEKFRGWLKKSLKIE